MATTERLRERISRYTDEQLLYFHYANTIRQLERRRKVYERLTSKSTDGTVEAQIDPDIERQIESLSEYVGACRAVYDPLMAEMERFAGGRRPYYISDYIKAYHSKKEATSSMDREGEYVLTALPIDESTYDGKTETPLYGNPDEFHASLLAFAWSGRKIYEDPYMYDDVNNPKHKNWIFSSTNTIASYLQAPLIAYEEQDEEGAEWVCMSFKDDKENAQVAAFGEFLPQFQNAMSVYGDIIRVETHDYESETGEQGRQAERMYTIKFTRPIYDGYNVAYHNKRPRPAFSINVPVYIPSRDSSLLLQGGFNGDFSELVDVNRRAQFIERMHSQHDVNDPALLERVDTLINQELEGYLLKEELTIGPDRLGDLDDSITSLEAHRLRTPLTSVRGYAGLGKSLLKDKQTLNGEEIGMLLSVFGTIEGSAKKMGDELSDSLKAVRQALISKQQVVELGSLFPLHIEEAIAELNRLNVDDNELELTMDFEAISTALRRLPAVAAIPFSFEGMIENALNNARRYGGTTPVRVGVFSSVEHVRNPDTGADEEVAYVDIVNYGNEIDQDTLRAMNNRNTTKEIVSANSKGTGRGAVHSRVAMDLSNNKITNPDEPSIFYRVHNLSEVTDGNQQGVMVRMGFRTLRSIRAKAADKLRSYRVVVNGKSRFREQYLQAA